jgi:hypothetical protein
MSEASKSGGRGDRVLNRKLQLLWRREQRGNKGENRSGSTGENKNERKPLREQLNEMSESDKFALRDRLQAQWDALPAAKQQKLSEKLTKAKGGKEKGGKEKGQGGGNAERKAKRKAKRAAKDVSAGKE